MNIVCVPYHASKNLLLGIDAYAEQLLIPEDYNYGPKQHIPTMWEYVIMIILIIRMMMMISVRTALNIQPLGTR